MWPAPHTAFLAAPAERRHLVCLALHQAGDGGAVPGDLLGAQLKATVRKVVPDAPDGLHGALPKLGERAWAGEDYANLVAMLRLPSAAKTLRHAKAITPERVRTLARLPAPVLLAGGRIPVLTPAQADALAEAYAAVERRRGVDAAAAAARRWGSTASAERLFEAALDELHPELPAPPFAGSERLRPLASKAALRQAAARYRNCLRTVVGRAASGGAAFYEWVGPPGAVLELCRDDVFGWRLDEARASDNEPVPQAARAAIADELRSWGVHVGRTAWQLEWMLQQAHRTEFRADAPAEVVGTLFGD